MRFDRILGVCLLTLLTLLLAAPALAEQQGGDSRSAQVRAQLNALHSRIEHVRKQITADSHRRGKLADALDQAQEQISRTRQHLETLDHSIAAHKHRITQLSAKCDAARGHLQHELASLRAQIRAAYTSGHVNRMRLLLSGKSPEKIGRMLVYYQYFANAESHQVKHLNSALAELAARQQALENEQAALRKQRAARAETLDQLEAGRKQQQATVAALDRRLSTRKSSLKDMTADEARIEKLLKSIQKQLSSLPALSPSTPFAQLKGHLSPPVKGDQIARFGHLKNGGPLRWQGEWLAAAGGTPIHAVASGRVVYVGYMKRYGLIVILDHGHNYYTLYGHAKSTYVDVGDAVRRGQPIGTAGHSGGHDRSGVYFEIRRGSTPVNPATWLSN